MLSIPFNRQYITGKELNYIQDCIARGSLASSGYYTGLTQEMLEKTLNCQRVLLTTSATSALELAMLALDIKAGDEVILPSYTFVSTANPILLRGARPIFAEIDPDTLTIDIDDVAQKITTRTRCIIPVHYSGVSCDMDKLISLAIQNNIQIMEDAAQGVGAFYKHKPLGTIGCLSCYSFHATKNIVSGEGGALIINDLDADKILQVEAYYEKGTNRRQFLRGAVERYTWTEVGSSFGMSDLLAAYLYAQLENLELVTSLRKQKFMIYQQEFAAYEIMEKLQLPKWYDYSQPNYHIYYMLCPDQYKRNVLLDRLKQKNIEATFHYIPLHSSPMGLSLGYQVSDLPITEDISSRLIRLPIYPDLTELAQQYVIDSVREIVDSW